MKTRRVVAVTVLFLCAVLLSGAWAAIPHLINYQGRLTDTAGKPLEGAYALTFRLYDAETAGVLKWEELHSGVVIQKGLFEILLGSVTPLSLPFDIPYYLEIKVGAEVMAPRQRITSAGYAIRAETADQALQAQNANTVATVGVSIAPAANKLLPLDANAKLPMATLKSYDSGWFAASASSAYTKAHNLGTQKLIVKLYYSSDPYGSNMSEIQASIRIDGGSAMQGSQIQSITETSLTVQTGALGICVPLSNGQGSAAVSGYLRVIVLALE